MKDEGDTTHLSGTLIKGSGIKKPHIRCDGCGRTFPVIRHSVERGQYDSPEWEKHARAKQAAGRS